jgi:hypothetical protein
MTDPDQIRPLQLSDSKLIAIDALLTGGTHRDAATAAGVQRSTVTAWANHHLGFITELGERRHQRARATGDLLDQTIASALRLIGARIDDGDLTAAIALLRVVDKGHLHRPRSGPRATPLSTTAQLAMALDHDLLTDVMLPDHVVRIIEQNSADAE